jgi:protein TonB
VLIEITVAKSGEPNEIRVLRGPPMLIGATLDAAKQWRFWPYRVNGKAVEVNMGMKLVYMAKPGPGHRCHLEHRPSPSYVHQLSGRKGYIP